MIIKSCQRCELSKGCESILRPRGKGKHPIMIIGEASGKVEDYYGIPFIGDSGKMLETAFNSVNLSTEDFFITNLVRCRPPENRTPTMKEIKSCYHYLYREIVGFNPKLIITLGNTPLKFFCGSDKSISKFHAQRLRYPLQSPRGKKWDKESPVFTFYPLYHPSALLRESTLKVGSKKWQFWQALIKLKTLYLNLPVGS